MGEQREVKKVAQLIPEGWLKRICGWYAILGGITIFGAMLMVTVDITMRRLLNRPIAATYDIAILSLLICVFTSLAWVMARKEHIEADLTFRKYPPGVKRAVNIVALFFSLIAAWTVTWGSVVWMRLMAEGGGAVTLVLRWPLAPFLLIEVIGSMLLGLVVLVQLVNSFGRRGD